MKFLPFMGGWETGPVLLCLKPAECWNSIDWWSYDYWLKVSREY